MEFTISSNKSGISPALDYTVKYTLSGGRSQMKTVNTQFVRINLLENKDYTLEVIARNKYGPSDSLSPLQVETAECSCMSLVECFSFFIRYLFLLYSVRIESRLDLDCGCRRCSGSPYYCYVHCLCQKAKVSAVSAVFHAQCTLYEVEPVLAVMGDCWLPRMHGQMGKSQRDFHFSHRLWRCSRGVLS